MLYMKFKREKVEIGKRLVSFYSRVLSGLIHVLLLFQGFRIAFYLVFPLGVLIFLAAYIFYAYDFERPAIWIALFAAVSKNIWGLFGALLMLGFTCRVGGLIRRFFCMPIFTTLGRISYCVYLVHFIAFRFLTGDAVALPYLSAAPIVSNQFPTGIFFKNSFFFKFLDTVDLRRISLVMFSGNRLVYYPRVSIYGFVKRTDSTVCTKGG